MSSCRKERCNGKCSSCTYQYSWHAEADSQPRNESNKVIGELIWHWQLMLVMFVTTEGQDSTCSLPKKSAAFHPKSRTVSSYFLMPL